MGERWVLSRIAAKAGFPLLGALRNAPIDEDIPGATLHRCVGVPGIDVEKLTYFAMSIFWRAAAHDWKQKVVRLKLGRMKRKFVPGLWATLPFRKKCR